MNNINYRLYKLEFSNRLKNFYRFFNVIGENYSEADVLPDHMLENYKEVKSDLDKKVEELDKDVFYTENIEKYYKLFSMLDNAKIDVLAYKAILSIESNLSIKSLLDKFKPRKGYSKKITYDTLSNVSGRLNILEGPNILTLPKRCRNIFESRFSDGEVISVDFVNLEPRLMLKLVNKEVSGDIYNEIKRILDFENELDRSIIKRAVISVLYGASHESLRNISAAKAVKIFESVKKFFEIEKLLELSLNIDDHEIRRNYFGRPIWNLDETKENILINNYIQSSAVDVALQYFCQLTSVLDLNRAVPIFIIHDAIVFDIEKEYINEFNNIIKKGYDDKDLGNFPLSTTQFNTKCD